MANTYTLISSNVLSSSAASVTFSAIPSTYTDLVLRITARGTRVNTIAQLYLRFNGDSGTNYSATDIAGTGATASSSRSTSNTVLLVGIMPAANATSNTFGSAETYIPSYTVSQNKPVGSFAVQEDNITTAYAYATAALWRNTAAITSIEALPSANDFAAGSSFYLYGIKNS
jgi:hypothetical protein